MVKLVKLFSPPNSFLPLFSLFLFFLSHAPSLPQDQVVRREQPSDHRPKSSYTGRDSSPQSPRDKRPLSGPNIRTPNLPVTEGVMKTAQQTTRPFNTYPRTDSEGGRSPTGQVRMGIFQDRWLESGADRKGAEAPREIPEKQIERQTDRQVQIERLAHG